MAVKYHCTKCGKRFVDWGAEKLNYKCTCAEGAELVIMTGPEDRPSRKPALRRAVRTPLPELAPVEVGLDEDVVAADMDIEDDEETIEEVQVGVIARGEKTKIPVDEFDLDADAVGEEFSEASEHDDEEISEDMIDAPPDAESSKEFEGNEEEWVD